MIQIINDVTVVTACTHASVFHADEVFGTVLIEELQGDVFLLRTFRVPNELPSSVITYDIGGGRFDHHMPDGNGCRKNGIPYSSAGLLWKEFGMQILSKYSDEESVVEFAWKSIDEELISGIDAVDNGKLSITGALSISKAISGFNPNWDETQDYDAKFLEATDFARIVLKNTIKHAISTAKAVAVVDEALITSLVEEHISVLPKYVPWQEHVLAHKEADVLAVVYPSNRGGYNWQLVPVKAGDFETKISSPKNWWGLEGEKLKEETSIAGAKFCHNQGFLGSAETESDAVQLAKIIVYTSKNH